jgi:hypothetical protein
MSHDAWMNGVIVIGLLHLMSGIGGIVVGGTSAPAGWWLVVVGILLTGLALHELRENHRAAE